MLQPEELELLVCGKKTLDFKELKSNTKYVDGYNSNSKAGKWLWEVVLDELTEKE